MNTWNGSFNAILRGHGGPKNLNTLLEGILRRIDLYRVELQSAHIERESFNDAEMLFADEPATIAIMGERGAGKSTLMTATCYKLRSTHNDIVTPILRPELYGPNESIISAFLASLWDLSTLGDNPFGVAIAEDEKRRLNRLLGDASRLFASAKTPLTALQNGSDGPLEFAEESTTISRSSVRVFRALQNVAATLATLGASDGTPRLIIVPIDDADLAADSVSNILRDLRILGSIAGVVPIFCLNPGDLFESWMSSNRLSAPYGALSKRYNRQLIKAIPYTSRFEIDPISPHERPRFKPIGQFEAIEDLMWNFESQLRSVFNLAFSTESWITYTENKFGLPNPLPDNARELVQFWQTIRSVDESTASQDAKPALIMATRRMLSILSERLRLDGAVAANEFFSISENDPHSDGGAYSIYLQPDDIVLHLSAANNFYRPEDIVSTRKTESSNIRLKEVSRVVASIPGDESPLRSSDRGPRRVLERESVSCVLAVQELVHSGLFEVHGADPNTIGYFDWPALQVVDLAGLETDNEFFFLPEAGTLTQVRYVVELWNKLAALSQSVTPRDLATAFVLAAVAFGRGSSDLPQAGTYDEAIGSAVELYNRPNKPYSSNFVAFQQWCEELLPFQWSTGILTASAIGRASAVYSSFFENIRDSSFETGRLQKLQSRIERAASFQSDQTGDPRYEWVASYLDFAEAMELTSLVDLLTPLDGRWRQTHAAAQAGSASVRTFVEADDRGTVKFSSQVTSEGTDLLGRARAMLDQLEDQERRRGAGGEPR